MPSYHPKVITASRTLTPSDAETVCLVNAAAGCTITLPAALGSGMRFRIVIGTTVTSNTVIIAVASASDTMTGLVITAQDAADTAVAWETAATSDTITLNGTTKGGIKGDRFELIDCATGVWAVDGRMSGTSTEVTVFSAAV